MREPVMLLSRPGARLEVVQRADIVSPVRLVRHLDEFGVLHHHGVDNAEEGLVGGEEACAAGEGVALKHALASVLGEDLDDATAFIAAGDVPLEVASSRGEYGVELVGDEFIW